MKTASEIAIRPINQADNPAVADLIKKVMTSYKCVGEGYSIEDPEVNDMFGAYNDPRSIFYVIESEDKILGCGGIAQLAGGDEDVCELKKMYFYPELRGKGYGRKLMDLLLKDAPRLGYKKCYLETVERMQRANDLYNKYGFTKLSSQEGNTGHCGCDTFYIKEFTS